MDCVCDSGQHIMRVMYDSDTDDPAALWFEFRLNTYQPWYKRVWGALVYLFGGVNGRCEYDAFGLQVKDVIQLIAMLRDYQAKAALQRTRSQG